MPDLGGARPVDDALADLARRRRDRWIVAVVLGLALLVLLFGVEGGTVAGARGAALALGVVGAVFLGAVVVEERRDRRLVRTLVAEQGRAAGRAARIAALEALEAAERDVLDVHDLPAVFDRLLVAALGLADAEGGIVVLRASGVLTVAAARGTGVPEPGSVLGPGTLAAAAFERGPLLGGRGSAWGAGVSDSSLAAPLRLPDRGIGVLVLVRGAGGAAFGPLDLTIAERFARHAALTLRSANRLDAARESAAEVRRSAARQLEATADLVHGLRTPLAASTGFLQTLAEGDAASTPDRRRAGLADTRAELAVVMDAVEELARELADGATPPAADRAPGEVVDLAALVRRVARTGRGLAVARGQAGSPEVTAPGPAPVLGDEGALRRIVVELLDNALTHGVGPVEVTVAREADEVRLAVRDHGADAPAAAARILEALAQRRAGQGLGVVARAVERHGGRIEVATPVSGGVRVRCSLPIGHP